MKLTLIATVALVLAAGLGCSPAADPVAKGGAHYQVTYQSDPNATGTCGLTSVGGIGDPTPPDLPSAGTVPSGWGKPVPDGKLIEGSDGNYTVECQMSKGNNHEIYIEMEGPNTSPQAGSATGLTGVIVDGTLKSDGTGSATISLRISPRGVATSTVPCTLAAVPAKGEPTDNPKSFDMSDEHAKFTFKCPEAALSLDPFSDCETRGTIQVFDCAKK